MLAMPPPSVYEVGGLSTTAAEGQFILLFDFSARLIENSVRGSGVLENIRANLTASGVHIGYGCGDARIDVCRFYSALVTIHPSSIMRKISCRCLCMLAAQEAVICMLTPSCKGLEYGRYGVSKVLDTAYQGFLGVGTTFDIFQNLHILYLEYGVLPSFGYDVLDLVSFVVFGEYRHRYAVSSLMDTAYWSSEQ
ncbi:hypothetical protein Tco_1343957 [Tanacetum coccineum]